MKPSPMTKDDILKSTLSETLAKLGSSSAGLTVPEAAGRLISYGPNRLRKKSTGALQIFLTQFQSSLIYLLIIADIISFAIRDYSDGIVILVILAVNTSIGFFQSYKSERIIEKLSLFINRQAHVTRDGQAVLIDESDIVPGDILTLSEGDIAPADMRLISATDLQINESQLTGESVPQSKTVPKDGTTLPESLIFAGSVIEKGQGVGIVYATGAATELGTIAVLSTQTRRETQYEKSLRLFSSFLVKVTLLGLAMVFVFKLVLTRGHATSIPELLVFILALAVAVVPEVLPVIASVSLANGALKLAKKHVVVKRLSALEDLGNVNLLCTDKTGTITENRMEIQKITSSDDTLFQTFAYAVITPLKTRKHRTVASYDDAFLSYVSEPIRTQAKHFTILKELPFDPEDRRRRVVIENTSDKKAYLVVIGAPETLLDITSCDQKASYLKTITDEGSTGLHHLGLAYKEITYSEDFDMLKNEQGLSFLGFVSLLDPLRPSVRSTLLHAEKLGIKVKILTGDGREVAGYIGKQINLIADGDMVYTGSELATMTKEELQAAVLKYNVFARVSPKQKYDIIEALKETHVVAYQGDGINDAPALKLADVAIAVNTATDIAKDSADIVLLDASLEVIVSGIKYGRSVFVNINKYIKYTMVGNFGNFIALAILYLISASLPLLAIQILLTNVLTDIPLILVSSDSVADEDILRPEVHDIRELVTISAILGIPTALFEIFYFMAIRSQSIAVVQTSLYVFLTLIGFILFYAIRSRKTLWNTKQPPALINIAFLVAAVVAIGVVYVPSLHQWLSFQPLPWMTLGVIALLSILYLFAVDFVKALYYRQTYSSLSSSK